MSTTPPSPTSHNESLPRKIFTSAEFWTGLFSAANIFMLAISASLQQKEPPSIIINNKSCTIPSEQWTAVTGCCESDNPLADKTFIMSVIAAVFSFIAMILVSVAAIQNSSTSEDLKQLRIDHDALKLKGVAERAASDKRFTDIEKKQNEQDAVLLQLRSNDAVQDNTLNQLNNDKSTKIKQLEAEVDKLKTEYEKYRKENPTKTENEKSWFGQLFR
jgi:hypothetical protein